MTDDELRQLAYEFRVGLIGANASPEGMCYAVAAPLACLLNACGEKVDLIESDHSAVPECVWYEHYWIRLADGRVLDPTFDQFCSEEAVPVYIGPPTEFHQTAPMRKAK